MKKFFLLLLSVCLMQPTSWSQQSPQGIPYQAAARSLDGSLIADRTIGIQFTLYFFENESDIRTDHYAEFHRITTDALGLFSVTIGEGTPQFGAFDNIPWSSQSMWIEVALDSENSGDLVPISNSPLLSVPYALHSLSASRIAGEEDRGPGGSNSNNWHTFGNANTDPSEDFLGTSDAADLSIITDSEERLRILATGEVSIDSDLSIGNDLDVGNNTSIGNDLDVSNNTSIGNDLDVSNNTSIGNDLNVSNNTSIGNDLNVSNNTSIGNDLDVSNNTSIGNDLDVSNNTSIGQGLDVQGVTQLHDDLNVTKADTGFIATFQNNNDGPGDGILIQLGKGATKKNDAAQIAHVAAKNYVGTATSSDLDNMKKLITGQIESIDDDWIANLAIPTDPAELQEYLEAIANGACALVKGIAPTLDNLLEAGLQAIVDLIFYPIDSFVLAIDVAAGFFSDDWIAACDDDVVEEATGSDEGCLSIAPSITFNYIEQGTSALCDALGLNDSPFSDLNSLNLGDWEDVMDPLKKENAFIQFADEEGWKMGAITAQSAEEWATAYLDPVFLYNLYATFRKLDKAGIPAEVKKQTTAIAKAYVAIGVSYSSGNGDYAEWLEREDPNEHIEAGDVVGVKAGRITRNLADCEQVMAISAKPIVLGNIPEEGKEQNGNNVAFMGQIPVKTMGPVESGDYIVGTGNVLGYAVAVHPEEMTLEDFHNTVGRSWESVDQQGPHMVNTVIGMHNGDYLNVLQRYENRMNSTEARLQSLESALENLTRSYSSASRKN